MPTTALAQFDGNLLDGLEFCSRVYTLYEAIRDASDGPSRMRMRPSRLEKKLLEELLPICKYVQASYRPGRYISLRWVDGNQQYDAEVQQRGAYVCNNYYQATGYLEVTCVMHPREYMSRELLEKKGSAFGLEGIRRLKSGEIESLPVAYTNKDFIDSYSKLLIEQISKKTMIPYPPNTTLIVQCTLNFPYMKDEWDLLIFQVQASLYETPFREIYLYDTVCQYSHWVYPRNVA